MQSNFSLLFQLKKPKNYESGPIPIYARITVNGYRSKLSANCEVDPLEWNIAAGRMKETKENVKSPNTYLDQFRANMYAAQQALNQKEEKLTTQRLKDTYLGKEQKARFMLEIFKERNRQVNALIGNEFSAGTATRYETSLKHTQNFIMCKYRVADDWLNFC
ncbi:Arm DNA-binding domain-containing protein [Mucilaginibacter xinganensis]|uniref:Recombinase n=1 Tax=Mucilaginibacter xinganensis TaxID=1234841 RepID=A0A223NWU6_9SPHI|nr:Arm DNA-binding domain-containing protein [Mucilaginibacter xinganensis]ASU34349.1 recombinase [Mucilaginibacter xinganensis]